MKISAAKLHKAIKMLIKTKEIAFKQPADVDWCGSEYRLTVYCKKNSETFIFAIKY